jgi:hypothetical protein
MRSRRPPTVTPEVERLARVQVPKAGPERPAEQVPLFPVIPVMPRHSWRRKLRNDAGQKLR